MTKGVFKMIIYDDELEVLDKILQGTKLGDRIAIEEDETGSAIIKDYEFGETLLLRHGITWICDAVDCKENLESCNLTPEELSKFVDVCNRVGITYDTETCQWDYEEDE